MTRRTFVYACILAIMAIWGPHLLDIIHGSPSILQVIIACSIPFLISYMIYKIATVWKTLVSEGRIKHLVLIVVFNIFLTMAFLRFWFISVGWLDS